MSKMFTNSSVIKLDDNDFKIIKNKRGHSKATVISKLFTGKDGYVMFYGDWCPHCRAKEEFWSYLAEQFNKNPIYQNENFRIGVVDTEGQNVSKIIAALEVGPIPRFMHVLSNPQNSNEQDLIDYDGDMSLENLIQAVCDNSATDNLCSFDQKSLNPPPIAYN